MYQAAQVGRYPEMTLACIIGTPLEVKISFPQFITELTTAHLPSSVFYHLFSKGLFASSCTFPDSKHNVLGFRLVLCISWDFKLLQFSQPFKIGNNDNTGARERGQLASNMLVIQAKRFINGVINWSK